MDWVVGGPFGRFSVLKNKDGLDETVETELAAIDSQINFSKTTATATKKAANEQSFEHELSNVQRF